MFTMFQILVLVVLSTALSIKGRHEDEVIILPGLQKQPTFRHYSGYLDGSDKVKLHYWFVESQNSPDSDPLVLWLNGGPGCSSLDGLLTENGPFQITAQSYLTYNPNSWNKIANVLYLESPSCVGFSYSTDGNCNASDDTTSILNLNALQHFLVKFPQFHNRDFYITGESYAGYYIPTLSYRIVSNKSSLPVKFKGIAIGNGLSSLMWNDNGNFYFAYNHGLISDSLWSSILSLCCRGQDIRYCNIIDTIDKACQEKIKLAVKQFKNINVYNIYSDCYGSDSKDKHIWSRLGFPSNYEKFQILSGWRSDSPHISAMRQKYIFLKSNFSRKLSKTVENGLEIPCSNDKPTTNYLNDPRVRYALHIPQNVSKWSVCSGSANFNYKIIYENMTSQYTYLFKQKDFRIWIYNGDVDMACSYLADEWYFERFNQNIVSHRKPWFYRNINNSSQIGGFVKVFENFVLLTIRGSGHMVPTDKPVPAYHMYESFLNGKML